VFSFASLANPVPYTEGLLAPFHAT